MSSSGLDPIPSPDTAGTLHTRCLMDMDETCSFSCCPGRSASRKETEICELFLRKSKQSHRRRWLCMAGSCHTNTLHQTGGTLLILQGKESRCTILKVLQSTRFSLVYILGCLGGYLIPKGSITRSTRSSHSAFSYHFSAIWVFPL